MSTPTPVFQRIISSLRSFFQQYPALPYILQWLSLSTLIGLVVGSASAGFLVSLEWVTNYRESHQWIIALLPVAGVCIGWMYHFYGREAEKGNNLLIDAIDDPIKVIPFRMAPFVYIGTLATHLFGGSAGREGTALQMAGALTARLSDWLRLSLANRSVMIMAAIAAGFGSVFGTPLAGAVFALEICFVGRLNYRAIFPVFAAAISADWVTSHYWEVPHTSYPIGKMPTADPIYFLYAVLAGIVFGLVAAAFSKLIHAAGKIYKRYISYAPLRPLIGGVIVAAIVFLLGTTRYIGLGIPVMVESFGTSLPFDDFAWKMLLTIITLSAGFKGGEVTPLFFIGATLGSALAWLIPLPVGLLAGMGFVAVFAGATNTPLACTIMGMTMFGADSGVYMAIACIVAYLFSGHTGIYGQQKIGEPKHQRFGHLIGSVISDLKRP